MADAGLRDDAKDAKARLINEIQRGDTARAGQTVSPDLRVKGDERLFKGAKEAIKQGLLTDPSDIEVIADKLSAKQVEELNALMTGPASTIEEMIPVGPTPNLSSAMDGIDTTPGQQFENTPWAMPEVTPDTRTPREKLLAGDGFTPGPAPSLGGEMADERLEGPGEGYWPKEWVEFFKGTGAPSDYGMGGPTTGGGLDYGPTTGGGLDYGPTTGGGLFPGPNDPRTPKADALPPDMGLPMPDFGSPLPMGGPGTFPVGEGMPAAPPPVEDAVLTEDPIIELAGSASSKDEALAIADEAEASGLFPGARAKVMKAFGWDEEGAQDFGRALMGFGSGLLQGGPDFGAALGAGFAKGADEFVGAKDDRRQAALDDRRIAMEDERLDMAREEMNEKRRNAALERLEREADVTGSGLDFYVGEDGRVRSHKAAPSDGPEDQESKTDLERYDYWFGMPEDTPANIEAKRALGRKWGFVEKTQPDQLFAPVQ